LKKTRKILGRGKHVILAVDTLPDSSQPLQTKERIITLKNDMAYSCRSLHYSPFLTIYLHGTEPF
jgi:hypothetical protein